MAEPTVSTSQTGEIDYNNPPFPLTAIDRELLAMRDEDFHLITWSDLQSIIANNTLENLKRLPSDLRRYLAWSHDIKQRYGGITNFVIRERLRWTPNSSSSAAPPNSASASASTSTSTSDTVSASERHNDKPVVAPSSTPQFSHHSAVPFADRRDYVVLANDWPYGFAPGITHLLVWSKTPIEVDRERGDVTAESRRVIEEFVERLFVDALGGHGSRVLWFKNWVSLQSVRGVDHVHVLVREAPEEVVKGWTARKDL